MIKLKRGIFESISSVFAGPVNFLISYASGKFHASTSDGASYSEIDPLVFGTSNINAIDYGADLSTSFVQISNVSLSSWTTISSPSPGNLYGAYGLNFVGNTFISGLRADNGILSSTNGISWSTGLSGTFDRYGIRHFAYGNGIWVAAGDNGRVATSTNAINWVSRNSLPGKPMIGNFYAAAGLSYGNGIFLLTQITDNGRSSTDGITWTTVSYNIQPISSIAYGNGIWVGRCPLGSGFASIISSTNTVTWTTRVSSAPYSDDTIYSSGTLYGNNIFFVVGGNPITKYISTDAISWTSSTINVDDHASVSYGNNVWGLVTRNTIGLYSTDTITWVTFPSIQSPVTGTHKIARNDNRWVFISNGFGGTQSSVSYYNNESSSYTYPNNAFIAAGNNGTVGSSTNGISWTTRTSNISTALDTINYGGKSTSDLAGKIWVTATSNFGTLAINAAFFGNTLLIGGYNGTIRTSTDAVSWVTRTSNFGNTVIRSIGYGNVWIIAGDSGQMRSSTDAVTWTTRTSNFGSNNIYGVAYGNGLWVAGGLAGEMRTSTDAITWVTRTSNFGTDIIFSIGYGNDLWVAVGQNNQIRTSTNAINWVTRTSNFTSNFIYTVSYGNGSWVAGAYNGEIRSSTNAISWATRTSNLEISSWHINSIAYGNGLWVAGASNQIRTSTDTITWTTRVGKTVYAINSIAYGNGLWVAGTAQGEIQKSMLPSTQSSISYFIGGI